MIDIGSHNTLKILRQASPGLFLADEDENEVLLPNRYVPDDFHIGQMIDVFVYLDNDERLVAVTDNPYIKKNSFALLRCNSVSQYGAFLDWGMLKELFCPFKEQVVKMNEGKWYLVYCYLDEKTNRLVASSRTNRFLSNNELTVKQFDEVDLIVSHFTQIGANVIINSTHLGLVFKNSIFKSLNIGDKLKGYIKKIRPGNRIDVSLQDLGYRNIETSANHLLELINKNDGYLNLTDKSKPEEIKLVAQMSKKSFKKALGSLYKQRLITLENNGIFLKKTELNG